MVSLQVPAIQDFIWKELPENVRGRDKWDRLTQTNLMVIWRELASVINQHGAREGEAEWVPLIIDKLLDVFELAGFVNHFNFTAHRREVLRPALPAEYKRLASESFPPTPEWLLGDELGESVEKISKENKLTEKMFPKTKPKKGGVVSKKQGYHHQKGGPKGKTKGKKSKPKGRKDSVEYHSPLPQSSDPAMSFDKKNQGGGNKEHRPQNQQRGVSMVSPLFNVLNTQNLSAVNGSPIADSPPFRAGNIANHIRNWEKLTSDKVILDLVRGVRLSFTEVPLQDRTPREYKFNREASVILSEEIRSLEDRGIVSKITQNHQGLYLSNVFLRPKPNGKHRMILDLSKLNDSMDKKKFKMAHLDTAIALMSEGCFMGSIDLRDAFYTVAIHHEYRRFLCFPWKGSFYQFNAMPFGLTSAPRIFTKILKPVFSDFRANGHEGFTYLDDSFVIGRSKDQCYRSLHALAQALTDLGFRVHVEKSVFEPSQEIVFLGYIWNSASLTVRPTPQKVEKLVNKISDLISGKKVNIRAAASVLGLMNDMCKGVDYGLNHVKALERDKIKSLRKSGQAQFEGIFRLSAKGGKT